MKRPSRCVLQTLDNPQLNGLTLGLNIQEDDTLALQVGMFPCCAGEGFVSNETLDGLRRCSVRRRIKLLQRLIDQFRQIWPLSQKAPYQASPAWVAQALVEIASVIRHDKPPCTLQFTRQRQQVSNLWSKAFAVLWRFGITVRVLNLQKCNAAQVVAFTEDQDGPLALFVEQVDKLWDPLYAEWFEFIVQRAYNSQAFLWIDMVQEQANTADDPKDMSLKASFSRKIAQMRSKDPLDHLSQDCLSRLESLSGGPLRNREKG